MIAVVIAIVVIAYLLTQMIVDALERIAEALEKDNDTTKL